MVTCALLLESSQHSRARHSLLNSEIFNFLFFVFTTPLCSNGYLAPALGVLHTSSFHNDYGRECARFL